MNTKHSKSLDYTNMGWLEDGSEYQTVQNEASISRSTHFSSWNDLLKFVLK